MSTNSIAPIFQMQSNSQIATMQLDKHSVLPVATMQLDKHTNPRIATMQLDEHTDSRAEVYDEEDVKLAKQWGISVPEMLETLEIINLQDPNEGEPEYSPEWPIDFIGDGFYANDLKWLQSTLNQTHDIPLRMHPRPNEHLNDSICVSVDEYDDES
jgi:hypothetical protein